MSSKLRREVEKYLREEVAIKEAFIAHLTEDLIGLVSIAAMDDNIISKKITDLAGKRAYSRLKRWLKDYLIVKK